MTNKGVLLAFTFALSCPSYALVHSSTLKYQLTDMRVKAENFQNLIIAAAENKTVLALPEKITEATEAFTKTPAKKVPNVDAVDLSVVRGKIPAKHPQEARIFVVDEEALLNGKIQAVPLARVFPVGPQFAGPTIMTAQDGMAKMPFPLSESVRFFVRARGYMMGMGYATFGDLTIVPLISKKRFSVLAKSLNLTIPSGQMAIFGRIMDGKLRGIADAQVQFKSTQPQVVYSGPFLGGIHGYFAEGFKKTDQVGSFIANGLSRSQHNLSVLHADSAIPGFKFDLSGIPESVHFVSLALQSGSSVNLASTVVDGESFERPDCGLRTIISNHTKPAIPDADGNIWVESKFRPTVNDIAVNTDKCEGYLPTYLSQASHESLFPPMIGLFTTEEINATLSNLHRTWEPSQPIVLGHVYPQKEFKHAPINQVTVKIFSPEGELVPAEILYFNSNNELDPNMTSTDAHHQNFLVLGLEPGENHFFYQNASDGSDLGIQVVRTYSGGVTQVDL